MRYFSSYCKLKLLHSGVFTGGGSFRLARPLVRKKYAFLLLINLSNLLHFQPKMHQKAFGGHLHPDPLGSLQRSLDPIAGLREAYF